MGIWQFEVTSVRMAVRVSKQFPSAIKIAKIKYANFVLGDIVAILLYFTATFCSCTNFQVVFLAVGIDFRFFAIQYKNLKSTRLVNTFKCTKFYTVCYIKHNGHTRIV